LRETLGIVLIGLVIGIPAALVATRALSAMLYGVQTDDPVTLVIITSVLLIVSGIAGYLPARRASLVDPAVALRYE
jgi:ABC-type antimicrobial peptide transport system permease subunit